jgi:hypothetical protein
MSLAQKWVTRFSAPHEGTATVTSDLSFTKMISCPPAGHQVCVPIPQFAGGWLWIFNRFNSQEFQKLARASKGDHLMIPEE